MTSALPEVDIEIEVSNQGLGVDQKFVVPRQVMHPPGSRLPTETDLCRSFELARSTVRETLRSLQDRGIIRMVARRGAFVNEPHSPGWLLQVSEGFFEGKVDHNHENVETEVLHAGLLPAPKPVTDALGIGTAKVYTLKRLRRLDGHRALYSVNYLLPQLAPVVEGSEVVKNRGSLNKVLREAGYRIHGAQRSVEAVAADKHIAGLLGVAVGAPLLLVTSRSWGADEQVFDFYTSWLRSDVVKVNVIARAQELAQY